MLAMVNYYLGGTRPGDSRNCQNPGGDSEPLSEDMIVVCNFFNGVTIRALVTTRNSVCRFEPPGASGGTGDRGWGHACMASGAGVARIQGGGLAPE
jgi:hypothetical protein